MCIRDSFQSAHLRHVDSANVDVHMPEMSGLELCRLIKEDPAIAKTHVILRTASGQRGNSMLAKEAGAAAYLTKPIRERHLADCMRLTLDREGREEEKAQLITRHTLTEVKAKVREYIKYGATCPILYPLGDVKLMIDTFADGY